MIMERLEAILIPKSQTIQRKGLLAIAAVLDAIAVMLINDICQKETPLLTIDIIAPEAIHVPIKRVTDIIPK